MTISKIQKSKIKGFTLIELLTVIAIIAILSSMATVIFSSAREKGRDAERIAELQQLALAVERYYDACDEYPDASLAVGRSNGCTGSVDFGTFIGSIMPTDPNEDPYLYGVSAANDAFILGTELENEDHAVLKDDVPDGTVLGVDCTDPVFCIES